MATKILEIEPKKAAWSTPELTVYGALEQITLQTKNKTFGAGDDVIVNNQAILSYPS